MQEVFMASVIFEKFALQFGQHHLIDKAASLVQVTSENVGEWNILFFSREFLDCFRLRLVVLDIVIIT